MDIPSGEDFKPTRRTKNKAIAALGKVPPQALELEEAVLGALMIENDAIFQIEDILKPDSFYKEAHGRIYNAIITLSANSQKIDILTVTEQLRKSGELELVGGAFFISELIDRVDTAAHIEAHARIISEMAIKRSLISVSHEIQKDAFEAATDAFELLDKAERELYKVSENNIRQNYEGMASLVDKAINELKEKQNQTSEFTGVPSGFVDLDRVTGGWQKSELIIIAARPGMGKTAFVLSAARNAAIEYNMPVAIFSLEMSNLQLVFRLIAGEARLESGKLKSGKLAKHEWTQLMQEVERLTNAPLYIDDTAGISITELRAKARRLKAKHDIQLLVVDYLQLMRGDASGKNTNREQEIALISRSLKGIAKELNIPVIALSQLNRNSENRTTKHKRPQLSDLRESGSIEQDADVVSFLYRPDYYGIEGDEEGEIDKGLTEVILAKHRSGGLETVEVKFLHEFTKFVSKDFNAFDVAAIQAGASGGANSFGNLSDAHQILTSRSNKPNNGSTIPPGEADAPF